MPKFKLTQNYGNYTEIDPNISLGAFLTYNVALRGEKCKSRSEIFYFRVNSHAEIDSIYSEGNLTQNDREQIVTSIKNTNKNWQLPLKTERINSCWFVFPCFIFNNDKSCTETDKENFKVLFSIRKLLLSLTGLSTKTGIQVIETNAYYPKVYK